MICQASFDIDRARTLEEWFAFWNAHKHQDPTRVACIDCCDNFKLKNLERLAFLVYIKRKINKKLVVDTKNVEFRVRMLVNTSLASRKASEARKSVN